MTKERPLSVQSFCFREFPDNRKTVQMVKDSGVDGIELWKGHIDYAAVETHEELMKIYSDAGVSIVSIGVSTISGDEKADRVLFDFARKAGCRAISVDFPLPTLDTSLEMAEKLTEEYGIPVGIHNHGGRHWLGNAAALEWVFSKTSARIGLSLDTGWALDSREDPVAWVRKYGERVHLLHLKDFTFAKNRDPEEAILGEGNLDLRELAAALTETNFDGLSIIEYEGKPDDPVPEIKKCVTAVKTTLSDFFD
jgi:sugar phosphate isomerase/epimerase